MRAERGHSPLPSPLPSLQEAPGQGRAQKSPGAASARTYPASPATSSRPDPPSRRPPPASRQTNPPALRRHWLPAAGSRRRPLAGSAVWSRPRFRHLGSGGRRGLPCWGGRWVSMGWGGVAAAVSGGGAGRVRWGVGGHARVVHGKRVTHSTKAVCGGQGWVAQALACGHDMAAKEKGFPLTGPEGKPSTWGPALGAQYSGDRHPHRPAGSGW